MSALGSFMVRLVLLTSAIFSTVNEASMVSEKVCPADFFTSSRVRVSALLRRLSLVFTSWRRARGPGEPVKAVV